MYAQEEYPAAEAAFREASRLKPGNAHYHYDVGRVLYAREEYPAAEAAYREAVRLDQDDAQYHYSLGRVLNAQRKYPAAEGAFREAARLKPENAAYHYNLGYVRYAQQKYANAEASYREAVRLKPDESDYRGNLTAALFENGKYNEAIDECQAVIQQDPHNAEYHNMLARLLSHDHSYLEAEKEAQKAISLSSSAETAVPWRVSFARILLAQERLAEAEEQLTTAARSSDDNAMLHHLLGASLERREQAREAEAEYRKAIAIDVTTRLRFDLAMLLSNNRRFNEAAEEAYRALEEDPNSSLPLYGLGLIALGQAEEYHDSFFYRDAIQNFRRALSLSGQKPRSMQAPEATLHLRLGYAYGKLRQQWRAAEEFRKAKNTAKYHSQTWFEADANLRRYQFRHIRAHSEGVQMTVFMVLGIALSIAIILLELNHRLTDAYLTTFVAFIIVLFIISFSLPIVTNIRLGPVSLEKKTTEAGLEQLTPIAISQRPLGVDSGPLREQTRVGLSSHPIRTQSERKLMEPQQTPKKQEPTSPTELERKLMELEQTAEKQEPTSPTELERKLTEPEQTAEKPKP